jgi:hypothetical protein
MVAIGSIADIGRRGCIEASVVNAPKRTFRTGLQQLFGVHPRRRLRALAWEQRRDQFSSPRIKQHVDYLGLSPLGYSMTALGGVNLLSAFSEVL